MAKLSCSLNCHVLSQKNPLWTVESKICSKYQASNVFPVSEAGCRARVNAGGGDNASVSQRPDTSQHTPRKPKIDPLLRTRGMTTPGPVSCEVSNARPFNWFLLRRLNLPPVAFSQLAPPLDVLSHVGPRSQPAPARLPAGRQVELAAASSSGRPLDLCLESQNRTDRDPVVTPILSYRFQKLLLIVSVWHQHHLPLNSNPHLS